MAKHIDNTVFIIADFGNTDESRELINQKLEIIKEACTEINIVAESSKDFKGGGKIIEKIKKAIAKSEFILCDISEPRKHPNANVYYEFGLAHGYENGKHDLLSICDTETFNRHNPNYNIPFDISAEHIHIFGSDEELKEIIKSNLEYMRQKREKQ